MIRWAIRGAALGLFVAAGFAVWLHYAPRLVPTPPAPLPPLTGPIDRIEIDKSDRTLTVFKDGKALRSYAVALGFAPDGDKTEEGDGRTPEGLFRIDRRNPDSKFHLSLGIDYPHEAHIVKASARGVSPGGDIFIHGQPNALPSSMKLGRDWTAGCIAVTNAEIEELWAITPMGTEVLIRP